MHEANESDLDNSHYVCTLKTKKKKQTHRAQKFRSEWLNIAELNFWLLPVKTDPYKAKCKVCNITIVGELTNIKIHEKGKKHLQNCEQLNKPISTFFKTILYDINTLVQKQKLNCLYS